MGMREDTDGFEKKPIVNLSHPSTNLESNLPHLKEKERSMRQISVQINGMVGRG